MSLPWPPARARIQALVGEWATTPHGRSGARPLEPLVDAILAFHALEMAHLREWLTASTAHHSFEHASCGYREHLQVAATLTDLDHVKAELAEWKQRATQDLLEASTLIAELIAEVKTLRAQLQSHKETVP